MTITLADLRAKGFDVGSDGQVRRVGRPRVRAGIVIAFDPSLNETGAAALAWPDLRWLIDEHSSPRNLADAENGPFGPETAILNAKLAGVRQFAAVFVRRAREDLGLLPLPLSASPMVLVEGTYYRASRGASPESVVKYGVAVGCVASGAARMSQDVIVIPPNWASEVLCGKGGHRDPKLARWRAARDLIGEDAWGAPAPEAIKPKSAHAHIADAKALCVAWAYRRGAFG